MRIQRKNGWDLKLGIMRSRSLQWVHQGKLGFGWIIQKPTGIHSAYLKKVANLRLIWFMIVFETHVQKMRKRLPDFNGDLKTRWKIRKVLEMRPIQKQILSTKSRTSWWRLKVAKRCAKSFIRIFIRIFIKSFIKRCPSKTYRSIVCTTLTVQKKEGEILSNRFK